jgi:membrane-associated PAP2 superfamily phosphatase
MPVMPVPPGRLSPPAPAVSRGPHRGLPHARHAGVACAFVAMAVASTFTGLDDAIAHAAYDAATGTFPARDAALLELVGHRLAKSALWVVWSVLLAASLAAARLTALAPYRRALWATTVAFALGPLVVSVLKSVTGPRCPWDLIEFGGAWPPALEVLTGTTGAGRCFPSGHASGGYALLSVHFAGTALGDARLRAGGLWLGLVAGTALGAVRVVQGAHFLSHNLWSAAVAWTVAALVFAIAYPPCRAAPGAPPAGPS